MSPGGARDRREDSYGDEEFRRRDWTIVGTMLIILTVGAWLIFSGLF